MCIKLVKCSDKYTEMQHGQQNVNKYINFYFFCYFVCMAVHKRNAVLLSGTNKVNLFNILVFRLVGAQHSFGGTWCLLLQGWLEDGDNILQHLFPKRCDIYKSLKAFRIQKTQRESCHVLKREVAWIWWRLSKTAPSTTKNVREIKFISYIQLWRMWKFTGFYLRKKNTFYILHWTIVAVFECHS